MPKDYYVVLGIRRDAGPEEIRKAYRRAAKRHHPDMHEGDAARFREIQEAYRVLSDPKLRAEYEQMMRALEGAESLNAPSRPSSRPEYTYSCPGAWYSQVEMYHRHAAGLVNSLFESLGMGFNTRPDREARPTVFIARKFVAVLDREEARTGGDLMLRIPVYLECTRCSGGRQVSFYQCPRCSGEGRIRASMRIKVPVPAGVRSGDSVRVSLSEWYPGAADARVIFKVK